MDTGSIYPTVEFLSWGAALKAGREPSIEPHPARRIRMRQAAASAGCTGRYSVPLASIAQAIRVCFAAKATAATFTWTPCEFSVHESREKGQPEFDARLD